MLSQCDWRHLMLHTYSQLCGYQPTQSLIFTQMYNMYIRADTNDFSSANALTPALVFVAPCSIPSLVAYSICYFVGTVDLMTM